MRNFVAKVHFSPEERDHIDAQAKALTLSRSELIRLRALGDPSTGLQTQLPPLSLRQYQDAVRAALKASQGACSRTTVEAVAAAVLCSIHGIDDQPAVPRPTERLGAVPLRPLLRDQ